MRRPSAPESPHLKACLLAGVLLASTGLFSPASALPAPRASPAPTASQLQQQIQTLGDDIVSRLKGQSDVSLSILEKSLFNLDLNLIISQSQLSETEAKEAAAQIQRLKELLADAKALTQGNKGSLTVPVQALVKQLADAAPADQVVLVSALMGGMRQIAADPGHAQSVYDNMGRLGDITKAVLGTDADTVIVRVTGGHQSVPIEYTDYKRPTDLQIAAPPSVAAAPKSRGGTIRVVDPKTKNKIEVSANKKVKVTAANPAQAGFKVQYGTLNKDGTIRIDSIVTVDGIKIVKLSPHIAQIFGTDGKLSGYNVNLAGLDPATKGSKRAAACDKLSREILSAINIPDPDGSYRIALANFLRDVPTEELYTRAAKWAAGPVDNISLFIAPDKSMQLVYTFKSGRKEIIQAAFSIGTAFKNHTAKISLIISGGIDLSTDNVKTQDHAGSWMEYTSDGTRLLWTGKEHTETHGWWLWKHKDRYLDVILIEQVRQSETMGGGWIERARELKKSQLTQEGSSSAGSIDLGPISRLWDKVTSGCDFVAKTAYNGIIWAGTAAAGSELDRVATAANMPWKGEGDPKNILSQLSPEARKDLDAMARKIRDKRLDDLPYPLPPDQLAQAKSAPIPDDEAYTTLKTYYGAGNFGKRLSANGHPIWGAVVGAAENITESLLNPMVLATWGLGEAVAAIKVSAALAKSFSAVNIGYKALKVTKLVVDTQLIGGFIFAGVGDISRTVEDTINGKFNPEHMSRTLADIGFGGVLFKAVRGNRAAKDVAKKEARESLGIEEPELPHTKVALKEALTNNWDKLKADTRELFGLKHPETPGIKAKVEVPKEELAKAEETPKTEQAKTTEPEKTKVSPEEKAKDKESAKKEQRDFKNKVDELYGKAWKELDASHRFLRAANVLPYNQLSGTPPAKDTPPLPPEESASNLDKQKLKQSPSEGSRHLSTDNEKDIRKDEQVRDQQQPDREKISHPQNGNPPASGEKQKVTTHSAPVIGASAGVSAAVSSEKALEQVSGGSGGGGGSSSNGGAGAAAAGGAGRGSESTPPKIESSQTSAPEPQHQPEPQLTAALQKTPIPSQTSRTPAAQKNPFVLPQINLSNANVAAENLKKLSDKSFDGKTPEAEHEHPEVHAAAAWRGVFDGATNSALPSLQTLKHETPHSAEVPVPVGNPLSAGQPHAQPGPGGAPHRASAQESEDFSYTYLPPAQHAYDFGDRVAPPKHYDDLAVLTSTGIRASAAASAIFLLFNSNFSFLIGLARKKILTS